MQGNAEDHQLKLLELYVDCSSELKDAETANQKLQMNFLAQAESAKSWKKLAEQGQGAKELLSATPLSAIIG